VELLDQQRLAAAVDALNLVVKRAMRVALERRLPLRLRRLGYPKVLVKSGCRLRMHYLLEVVEFHAAIQLLQRTVEVLDPRIHLRLIVVRR